MILRTDFHPACTCSFIETVGEIWKFTACATYEVNVISESKVGDGSSTDGEVLWSLRVSCISVSRRSPPSAR
ncbi:hypothetical protein DPMN_075960 [Dreissena polymorpha]|uniref:Uncharacterized protein n=1 Tax=Dreissena polymorpha TaxID=45954 RepID=A0A9D3YI80_DREPO|nr:hypothetical protein DPMN_075960 [Dreissena polymorpha]